MSSEGREMLGWNTFEEGKNVNEIVCFRSGEGNL